jgi:YidC/Oxa1 family membrane protein insertase
MLDSLFDTVAGLLNVFYELVPNYAVAIALLTCTVMLITTPLTLKGTRSMIEMQRLQPEIRRLQAQYRNDRQKLNEEMMAFYKEHQINPVGGCLPMLIQLPVFSILFYVIRGLIHKTPFLAVERYISDQFTGVHVTGGFDPKYLDHGTELYQSLHGQEKMQSFGIDLAISPLRSLEEGFLTALPYILIVAAIAGLSWYQQKQIMGRNRNSEVTPQQKMMMRLGPVLYVFFAFAAPAALCVYFLVSTLWRVGQQAFITHSLYKGEDSVGAQAQKAMAEARAERKRQGANGDKDAKATKATKSSKSAKTSGKTRAGSGRGTASRNGSGATPAKRQASGAAARSRGQASGAAASHTTDSSGESPKPHPRSRKKKKRK